MTVTVKDTDLFRTAHRVWTQFNSGNIPAQPDVEMLKRNALPQERRLKIDILACAIIQRELT